MSNFFNQMNWLFIFFGITCLLVGFAVLLHRRSMRRFKQAMKSLEESAENYRLLVKTIPSVVYRGYADWSVDFFDDKFEKITGFAIDDFNSRRTKWDELIVPEDLAKAQAIFKQALKTNGSYMREYRIRKKSGALLWIRERGQIVCHENGRINYVTGVCSDITEQQEMQAALERLQRQNEMILNSAGEGLFGLDLMGRVTFINPAALSLTGFTVEEVLGQNLHGLIHSRKPDGTIYPDEECPIYCTLKHGEKRQVNDDLFWTKEGAPLPVDYVTTPIEQGGQVVGAVGVFRDISERKRGEVELQRAYQYLEKVFDSSAEGIGIVDSNGLVRKWNKAAEEIYEYTFKELEGKLALDLYADKDELAKMLIHLRRDGYVKNYEIQMKKKDGSAFPCSLSIRVLRDEKSRNMGSVTVARDLTELKEKEAKLHLANEKLQSLVTESTQLNRQMSLLQEMSDVFQTCLTSGETYSAIVQFAPKFFPEYAGALYLLNNSKNLFEMMANWGEASSQEVVFGHDECWALRRSRTYLVSDAKSALNCRHVSASLPGSYLCLPLMAQSEALGMLHLQKISTEEPDQIKAIGQFATTVAEAMALALANLKLRETLRSQAIRDGLTGLFNRRYLEETLERELSRSQRLGNTLGVVMLDLDHFKEYNDTFGHNGGDELLVALGQMIQELVRKEDIACRYGGEEFLLIMPGAHLEVALERAQNLVRGIKQLHLQSGSLRPVTISAGVAIFPDHGSSGKEVVQAADAALYQAKMAGRDRVVVAGSMTRQLAQAS